MENTSNHHSVRNQGAENSALLTENIEALSPEELLTAIGHSEGRNWEEAILPNRGLIEQWWDAQQDKPKVIRDSAFRLALVSQGKLESEYPGILEFELVPILEFLGLICLGPKR